MPMMAVHEQNDARNSARLLARMALSGIEDRASAPSMATAMNNMYRLLEGYRSHGFFALDDEAGQKDDYSLTSLLPPAERHVGEVKAAFDQTFQVLFQDVPPDAALDSIESVLRFVTYPDKGPEPDVMEVDRAREFFGVFLGNLQQSR